jgi:hypothetical protein
VTAVVQPVIKRERRGQGGRRSRQLRAGSPLRSGMPSTSRRRERPGRPPHISGAVPSAIRPWEQTRRGQRPTFCALRPGAPESGAAPSGRCLRPGRPYAVWPDPEVHLRGRSIEAPRSSAGHPRPNGQHWIRKRSCCQSGDVDPPPSRTYARPSTTRPRRPRPGEPPSTFAASRCPTGPGLDRQRCACAPSMKPRRTSRPDSPWPGHLLRSARHPAVHTDPGRPHAARDCRQASPRASPEPPGECRRGLISVT